MATPRMCSVLCVVRTGHGEGDGAAPSKMTARQLELQTQTTPPVLASTLSWIILHKISQIIQNKSFEGGTKNLNCGKVFYNPS